MFEKKHTLGNRGNRGNRGNQGLIEMLTPEANWGCRLPRLPRLPPAFFYVENAFNNICYYYTPIYTTIFRKKHTLGNRGNRGNQGLDCTQSGPIAHDIRDNPLPCQKKVVILQRIRHLGRIADTAPLNRRATKASALPKNPRFSGAPRKMHR